ncbi:cobalamin-binding protein [bacterium]|nr:cobalamin-binding protein [bacterium]
MKIFKKSILVFTLLFVLSFFPLLSLADNVNYPLPIIDDTGTIVNILQEPQRIISAAPSNTEILFALGLGDKVVGVTDYANYPKEIEKVEKIGKMTPLNLEKIASLQPDLIIAFGGFQLKEIPRLRELGFSVLVIEPLTIKETLKSIKMVAKACGVPERGSVLVKDLLQRTNKIESKVSKIAISARPKVFIGGTDETIYTPGEGILLNELITLAGGQNIAASLPGWVKISPEFVAEAEPDIIIIPIGAMNPGEESKIKENISQRPGWSNIPAIKTQSIFIVNEDLFYRAGPRLVDGLELLYEIFHK